MKQFPIEYTITIDVCPTDANLLASGGTDLDVKIYDRRECRIVKIFNEIHRSKMCFALTTSSISHNTISWHQLCSMETKWRYASYSRFRRICESR